MDPRLLRAYNEELAYLRESAREFGQELAVLLALRDDAVRRAAQAGDAVAISAIGGIPSP